MYLSLIQKKIITILSSKQDTKTILKQINNVFNDYAVPADFRKKILADAQSQYSWLKNKVMSDDERSDISKELHRHQSHFATAKKRIQSDVLFIVSRGLRRDDPTATIRKKLVDRLGVLNYHANAIVETAKAGFANIDTFHQASEAGDEYFTYTGPPGERNFCQERLGKTYHISEIRTMNNGQGLPVLYYCGGYNCHHSWSIATAAEVAALGVSQ